MSVQPIEWNEGETVLRDLLQIENKVENFPRMTPIILFSTEIINQADYATKQDQFLSSFNRPKNYMIY